MRRRTRMTTRLIGCFVGLALCVAVATAAVINVPDDYSEIQAAIEAANEGDIVLVQPGTYVETLNFLGKGVTVTGTAPEDSVVVASTVVDADGQGSVVTFASGEDSTSVLAGLTITGGTGTDGGCHGPGSTCGGGIYCAMQSSPVISHSVIVENSANGDDGGGGGVYCQGAAPKILHSRIIENSATHRGGGIEAIDNSYPHVTHCSIVRNVADTWLGGGAVIRTGCSARFMNTTIAENTSLGGAGVYASHGDSIWFDGCQVIDNTCREAGGGVRFTSIHATISNSSISRNSAVQHGGGIQIGDIGSTTADISNVVVWNNTPTEILNRGGIEPLVVFSDIRGGWPGEGNIDSDPLFVDPENGDYHLQQDSPCIDAGDPTTFDACLPPGLGGPRADMGAYGGEENCGWLPPCDDLALAGLSVPSPVYAGDTAQGSLSLWNCSDAPIDVEATWGCPWLDVVPAQGTIPPQTTVDLALDLDAFALVPGSYSCPVTISYGNEGEIVATVRFNR